MALRNFLTGLGLVILFSLCLIMFMTQFILQNNPDPILNNSAEINYVNEQLDAFTDKAEDLEDLGNDISATVGKAEPSLAYVFLITYSAFEVPLKTVAFLLESAALIILLPFTLLFGGAGDNPYYVIFGLITGLIYILAGFLVLRALRSGDTG